MKRLFLSLPLLLTLGSCGGGSTSTPSYSASLSTPEASSTLPVSISSAPLPLDTSLPEPSSLPPESALTLYRDSKLYVASTKKERTFDMPTYYKKGEEGVPYVRLSDYVRGYEAVQAHTRTASGEDAMPVGYEHKDGAFCVNVGDKHELAFSFFADTDRSIIHDGAKAIYRWFYDLDPYSSMHDGFVRRKESACKYKSLWDSRTIDLARYGFDLIEENDELYAPFSLYDTIFSNNASIVGLSPIAYNGQDFYLIVDNDTMTGCNSSNLTFSYTDRTLLMNMFLGRAKELGLPSVVTMHPHDGPLDEGEAYRLETDVLVTKEIEGKGKLIPDLRFVLSLKDDDTGTYRYADASTGETIASGEFGLVGPRPVTYEDRNGMLTIVITSVSPTTGQEESETLCVNKGQTFYRATTRNANYAIYDYNVTRLHFGEFYGIRDNAPLMKDVDARLAPYKEDLLSTDCLTYSLAMARFLYESVDDGHTTVQGFGMFSPYKWEDYKKGLLDEHNGFRRKGLLDCREYLQTARKNAGLDIGYQIVGDTAYITFDNFTVDAYTDIRSLDKEPDYYANKDTVAFFLSALSDLSANHRGDVKRVVFDLSCNGGGAVAGVTSCVSMLMGETVIRNLDLYNGGESETHYEIDLDGNGVYGENTDSFKGQFQYYVLTSAMSFSCGNAFPGICKESGDVTLIGTRSGGGCSMVDNIITPSGFTYTSSSLATGAMLDKDGHFVDNDRGIPVDLEIPSSIWYDRTALSKKLKEFESK